MPAVDPPEPTRLGEVAWLEPYPRRPARGRGRRAARPGGPLRADRGHLAGLRDRAPGAAAPPARRARPARRPRLPRERGGRDARLDRRLGQQRPQAGARRPAAPAAVDRRPRAAARRRLAVRAGARGAVRPRLRGRGRRRAGRPADRRRLRRPCRRSPSSTRAATPWPASSPASSARAGGSTSCRRGPTASRRSGPTCAPPTGIRHGGGLFVLTLAGDRISAFTRFDAGVLPWFGLPRSLPDR